MTNLEQSITYAGGAIVWFLALIWFAVLAGNRARKKQAEEIAGLLRDLNAKMEGVDSLVGDINLQRVVRSVAENAVDD